MRSLIIMSVLIGIGCGTGESVQTDSSSNVPHTIPPPQFAKTKLANIDAGQVNDSGSSSDSNNPTPVCTAPSCVRSFGYWKNHATWPCDDMMMAYTFPGAPYYINESEALTIMNMSVNGNVVLILLDEMIAAELNGGDNIPSINLLISNGRAWLMQYGFDTSVFPPLFPGYVKANSVLGQQAIIISNDLQKYNDGLMPGFASCNDCSH